LKDYLGDIQKKMLKKTKIKNPNPMHLPFCPRIKLKTVLIIWRYNILEGTRERSYQREKGFFFGSAHSLRRKGKEGKHMDCFTICLKVIQLC
jgi:hypothetical protein